MATDVVLGLDVGTQSTKLVAAASTGVPAGLPVVMGMVDTWSEAYGLRGRTGRRHDHVRLDLLLHRQFRPLRRLRSLPGNALGPPRSSGASPSAAPIVRRGTDCVTPATSDTIR
jgi:hypothetical protein